MLNMALIELDRTVGLREFLARHRLKQADLARGANLTDSAVSYILRGEFHPRMANIDAIIAFCRQHDPTITYEDLFRGQERAAAGASR